MGGIEILRKNVLICSVISHTAVASGSTGERVIKEQCPTAECLVLELLWSCVIIVQNVFVCTKYCEICLCFPETFAFFMDRSEICFKSLQKNPFFVCPLQASIFVFVFFSVCVFIGVCFSPGSPMGHFFLVTNGY